MASNIDFIVENFLSKGSRPFPELTFEDLCNVIEEQLAVFEPALQEEATEEEISVVWNGIPELQMSELAWGSATGEGGSPSDARVQLERFLNHVGVSKKADMRLKLKALESFYTKSEKTGKTAGVGKTSLGSAGIDTSNPKETIGRIIGYLTFYKTLTMILQNFNASAAGFTFESFIAVLLGGSQIPTGNQTIADLTSKSGKPISLKLLDSKGDSVKGSYFMLIDDLAGRGSMPVERMEYLVCLKTLTGDGPTLEGVIKFQRFFYDYRNVLDFLSAAGGEKRNNLRLPLSEDGVTPDVGRQLKYTVPVPNYNGESVNDDNQEWWQANFDEIFQATAAEANIENVASYKEPVLRLQSEDGEGFKRDEELRQAVETLYPEVTANSGAATRRNAEAHPAYLLAKVVNKALRMEHRRLVVDAAKARTAAGASAASRENYASFEDSVNVLREIHDGGDREAFFDAMTNTYGYVTNKQWIVTGTQIEDITKSIGEESYLGRLFVGQRYVYEMVNMYAEITNEKVSEIFRELKVLTAALQEFFTGGLQPSAAQRAIASSKSIGEKTAQVEEEI